jgi:hypothetical protein
VKYRTFIVIRNLVVVGVVALGGFGLVRGCGALMAREATPGRVVAAPQLSTSSRPVASGPARSVRAAAPAAYAGGGSAPDRQTVDSLHKEVLQMAKQPISKGEASGNSRKWRVKRGRLVIELRSDTGKGLATWNRAKIDMDGDKQFDEAWDFRPGGEVKRRVAPADDENYSATYDLRGNTWVKRPN